MRTDTLTIDTRFRGPPRSGNGGYACGRLRPGHVDRGFRVGIPRGGRRCASARRRCANPARAMKAIEVFSSRAMLIVLNCLCLALVLPMSYAVAMFAGPSAFALLLAPLSGLAAFIGQVRRKPLLLLAAATNLLLLAAAVPVVHGLAREPIPLYGFAMATMALFGAPLLTVTACWLRWPRLRRETPTRSTTTQQPGAH